MQLLNDLFENICVLGMLLFTLNLFTRKRRGFISRDSTRSRKIQFGVCMGMLGILLMYQTIQIGNTIVDIRQIPVVLAAFFGGFWAAVIASVIIAVGRMALFDTNTATIYAVVLILLVGISSGLLSKLKIVFLKKWLLINLTNLLMTSAVFFLVMNDKKLLLQVYAGFWTVSLTGGIIVHCLMEYFKSTKLSEERYRSLVEMSPFGISLHKEGKITYINPAGIEAMGMANAADIIGTIPLQWVHPEDRAVVQTRIENTMQTGFTSSGEYRILALDGEVIDVAATSIFDEETSSIQLVFENITARKQAEYALSESELKAEEERKRSEQMLRDNADRYLRLQMSLDRFSGNLFGVLKDSEADRLLVKEVQEMLGTTNVGLFEMDRNQEVRLKCGVQEVQESILQDLSVMNPRSMPVCEIMETSNGYLIKIGEIRGSSFLLCIGNDSPSLRFESYRVWLKTIARYASILYDNFRVIEDLSQELEQLASYQAAPSWLLRLLFNLSENERKNLSQELHDAALQEQFIWYRKLDQLSSDLSVSKELREQLYTITQGLLNVIYQIQITCNELRPPILKEGGLVSSLETLFERTQLRCDYSIYFDGGDFRHTLGDELAIGIYRIVQDLLTNAAKHSKASRVRITLASFPDRIHLVYEDNGVGMDIADMQGSLNSMGVYGMKERVRSMDGTIDFDTVPGKGFFIFISIPAM